MTIESVGQELQSEVRRNGCLSIEVRKKRLENLKKSILLHEESITQALKNDLGKSPFEAYATEIGFILEEINFILKNLDSWTKSIKVSTPLSLLPGTSWILPSPHGVVLIISPWNYPFQLSFSPLIGAICAGNRVVLKPSEYSLHTREIIKLIIEEVFLDSEVQLIIGEVKETQILLNQKFDYIFFTGSTETGRVILKAASEHLTPVTLELGGKSPFLIEESANLTLAAKRCAWGKFLNAGQTCVAPDYVLVPRSLQDDFITKVKFFLEKFYGNNPEISPDYSRIINTKHFERVHSLIVADKVVHGGKSDSKNLYISPTILKDICLDDKIMREEIFGPVLPLIPYDNLDEAIEIILNFPKPLAFYLFSENEKYKKEIMETISFGGGSINDCVIHLANPNLPFGGVGMSGMGSYHGKKSFDTFSHFKSVFKQSSRVDIPFRYPPYERKLAWLKLFFR